MRVQQTSELWLILCFLGILVTVPVVQTGVELWRGDRVQALGVFRERPTSAHLRAYERQLEDESVIAQNLRPFAKYARFAWFKDGGDKAVIGRDGWLFYGPGLDYITRKPNPAQHTTVSNVLSAIIDFRDQLAARGIQLVVMPVPNKESIYPEKLLRGNSLEPGVLSEETRELLIKLEGERVPMVNLFELFASARRTNDSNLIYLSQDSHWSPLGLKLAATAVSRMLLDEHIDKRWDGEVRFAGAKLLRGGDILGMLRIPLFEAAKKSKPVVCEQVSRADAREVNRDWRRRRS